MCTACVVLASCRQRGVVSQWYVLLGGSPSRTAANATPLRRQNSLGPRDPYTDSPARDADSDSAARGQSRAERAVRGSACLDGIELVSESVRQLSRISHARDVISPSEDAERAVRVGRLDGTDIASARLPSDHLNFTAQRRERRALDMAGK